MLASSPDERIRTGYINHDLDILSRAPESYFGEESEIMTQVQLSFEFDISRRINSLEWEKV
jgi:hypothetical protein